MNKWEIKNRNIIYKGGIFTIQDLECYHPQKDISHNFYILKHPDWVNIVATTGDDELILVKQHRLGTDEFTIETPAGIVEPDESPEHAARRELMEETGYCANDMILLKKLAANPAIMSNDIYFYYAPKAEKAASQSLDLAEDIEIILSTENDTISMLKRNVIKHSIIITALSLFFLSDYCDIPIKELKGIIV
ncbi:MAG: NUDIX hydrolase [Spirochaetota bacterium]|nr:NUDIX hydrolase [Spirochaetota bacterium]